MGGNVPEKQKKIRSRNTDPNSTSLRRSDRCGTGGPGMKMLRGNPQK